MAEVLRAGVIGWPITHSLSPRIHRFWLAEHGLVGSYEAVAVPPDRLREAVDGFIADGWRGFNVTIPHKEAIKPLLGPVDKWVQEIGAVNTVVILPDGTLEGYNTDAEGFLRNLLAAGLPLSPDRTAAVLGAGGASRAVIAALVGAGFFNIRLANRNRARAENLEAIFPGVSVWDWDKRAAMLEGVDLLVNTTSLGMEGQPPLEIALDALPRTAWVNDIVYRPLETALLAAARERGNDTVDGLGMLLHQAVEGFAAWFGVVPQVTPQLRAHVLAAISHK